MNRPEVWTSRISVKDADAYNVTWKSGDRAFAPSFRLLGPMLDIRKQGRTATEAEWAGYVRGYADEMRKSYARHRDAWDALLARDRIVLTCYCPRPERCHRTLLGQILGKMGAKFFGELDARDPSQEELFEIMMKLGE